MSLNVLVTGGAGYIGSHVCIALLEAGYNVIVADNLCNSSEENIIKVKKITSKDIKFYKVDIANEIMVDKIFSENKIDGVIHLAGLKSISESVENSLEYYLNNVVGTLVLLKICTEYTVEKFVFSSSATVYGDNKVPFAEDMTLLPTTNPYGETKIMIERILKDMVKSNPLLSVTILRYFNPVGAHKSGMIGEIQNEKPNNLMPLITQTASGKIDELKIFGGDYPTDDGTGVRDYIHVVDLAEGHIAALQHLNKGIEVYNLGSGKGTSVLELIQAFEKINNINIPYKIIERRNGDIASCYADVSKANRELNWETKYDIKEMCKDAWEFERKSMNVIEIH